MGFPGGKRIAALVAAVGVLGAGAVHLGTGTASAAFSPRSGPVFNNPTGNTAQQYAIMRQIERNIDTAPKGSVIRVAVYSITLNSFADKLIAAHRRGVYVRFLMDQHSVNGVWQRLASALGTKVNVQTSASSYAALCSGGCMGRYHGKDGAAVGSLHTKFFLFSGGGKPTVTISSANPTATQAEVAWNNSYTVVGNKSLYNAYVKNFNDMSKGALGSYNRNYYWTSGANPKAYFWPKSKGSNDTILGMLQLVTCSKTYPSQVRVAMFQWTDGRLPLARQLVSMAAKGCRVTVIYTKDSISPAVQSTLAKSKVVVRDTTFGRTPQGYAEHYTHNKYLLIDGRYGGTNGSKIVMTGSANYTVNGLYYNDESNLKLTGATMYAAYLKNFNDQIASVPALTAQQRAEGRLPAIPVDPAQLRDS
ncbi:Phosphatidylserine/phosphatidylglycerophosphate/cardiolipin synthase [Thermomonospora echinospora]|uniref:phospholipase D n=1 Tax=Thermomonospora echinospora TaxID=1992 RepID=A0A1H6CMM3_9ACTN|nr:phospholipase D-like domain-containing protein [Thermomonospora echinospora]SEG74211.1 Phosphatidylserine/phosphatidylglycerophosphate/cardiolipin synthase [Thermomonospora echinospora]